MICSCFPMSLCVPVLSCFYYRNRSYSTIISKSSYWFKHIYFKIFYIYNTYKKQNKKNKKTIGLERKHRAYLVPFLRADIAGWTTKERFCLSSWIFNLQCGFLSMHKPTPTPTAPVTVPILTTVHCSNTFPVNNANGACLDPLPPQHIHKKNHPKRRSNLGPLTPQTSGLTNHCAR